MSIVIEGLRKSYRAHGPRRSAREVVALDSVDLEVHPAELLVVVGPSGSGKSTLLRIIAGLEQPDAGRVEVDGKEVTSLDPGQRDVAMVFQEYALFPHLTVRANIGFGLEARKEPRGQLEPKIRGAAERLGIDDVLDRLPEELSGGERQRVALARAVVREPAAFLMDEPLSNLDAELRLSTRGMLRALQRAVRVTTLYVTHDQTEAMTMGDRIVILREGRVEQIGTPVQVYERPASAFVARFIGSPPMNLFAATLLPGSARGDTLGVRPERLSLVGPGEGRFDAAVTEIEHLGGEVLTHVDAAGEALVTRATDPHTYRVGDIVGISFGDPDLYAFESPDGKALP